MEPMDDQEAETRQEISEETSPHPGGVGIAMRIILKVSSSLRGSRPMGIRLEENESSA